MLTRRLQALAGVSADYENVIEELYPSVGMTTIGRLLDTLYESIPGVGQVKLSYLLFVPWTWPLGIMMYFTLKVIGERYIVTNRAVKRVGVVRGEPIADVPIEDVESVRVVPGSIRTFFRCGDLELCNSAGGCLMLLPGVSYPDRFAQVIVDARDARRSVTASLEVLRRREAALAGT